MSWSGDPQASVGTTSVSEEAFVQLVQRETGFTLDRDATDLLRAGCELPHFRKDVAVFKPAA